MATRPPRITSTRRQRTTRGGPVVTSRTPQANTGRGRVVRQPSLSRVFAPSWGRPPTLRTGGAAVSAGGVPASSVSTPQFSLTNLPVDASYDQQIAQLQRQRDEQFAQIAGERSRTLSDYGFQEGPNGMLTFDPNNPFSKSAVMKKTYDTNRRSTGQSMASGGQLYSGSFQNAQDLINRNQLQSEDALTKNLQAFLARNTGQRTAAGTGYETAAAQAEAERIARFQSNPLYDPAAADDGGGGGAPAPAAAAPAGGGGVTKVARGFVWQQNSNGTWRKIRPVNAFGH
jgi:hypothetical protein